MKNYANEHKNLDPEEVKKFNDIAEKWWDLEGEFKPLHQINPLRLNFIKERTSLKGKRILDIGCGGGLKFGSFKSNFLAIIFLPLVTSLYHRIHDQYSHRAQLMTLQIQIALPL